MAKLEALAVLAVVGLVAAVYMKLSGLFDSRPARRVLTPEGREQVALGAGLLGSDFKPTGEEYTTPTGITVKTYQNEEGTQALIPSVPGDTFVDRYNYAQDALEPSRGGEFDYLVEQGIWTPEDVAEMEDDL